MIFLTAPLFAYTDYSVNDISLPKSITSAQDLNINIIVANNSSLSQNIDLNLYVIGPDANQYAFDDANVTVPAHSTSTLSKTFSAITDMNLFSASQPYLVRAVITESGDSNPSNNSFTRYFTVRKASGRMPVPDMPIYLGFLVAICFVAFFSGSLFVNKKKSKSK